MHVGLLSHPSEQDIDSLFSLLNDHVSFGLATKESVSDLVENHQVYIVKEKKHIVSCLTLFFKNDYTEVRHVVTLPACRKRGYASSLLHIAIENYTFSVPLIAVGWVKPHGWEAEPLFLKKGFHITATEEDYWKKDCTSVSYCPYFEQKCRCKARMVRMDTK